MLNEVILVGPTKMRFDEGTMVTSVSVSMEPRCSIEVWAGPILMWSSRAGSASIGVSVSLEIHGVTIVKLRGRGTAIVRTYEPD